MTLFADELETPVARVRIAVDAAGAVKRLHLDARDGDAARAAFARGADVRWDAARCARVRRQVEEYFEGSRRTFDLVLAGDGTPFQRLVWRALCDVPFGHTSTYGEIARRIGRPGSARAVGRANATNPIAILVPCHRIVGSGGALTGYAGGLTVKQALLAHEAVLLPCA